MRLEYNAPENIFFWVGGYETKDIPKMAKFKWNPEKGRWETWNKEVAKRLIKYASEECASAISTLDHSEKKNIEMSMQSDINDNVDIDIPVPEGKQLFTFQVVGVNYIVKNKNVLLADEAGLGKTLQAIGVMNVIKPKKTIVVCPSLVKYNWRKEINAWCTLENKKVVIISSKDNAKVDADIYIVNYELLYRPYMAWLHTIPDTFLISDEAHHLKNNSSKTTKAFKKLCKKAKKLLLMTGTPMLNRPIEIYPLLTMVGCNIPYLDFIYRYCDAKETAFGIDNKGASNLGELQYIIRNGYYIRRTKQEVLPDLPTKIRSVIYLDPNAQKEFVSYVKSEQTLFGGLMDTKNMSSIRDVIKKMSSDSISDLAKIRKTLGLAKLPYLYDILDEALLSKDKIVIFAHHVAVVESIVNHYGADMCCMIHGATDSEQRFDAVNSFQNDASKKLFVGTIDAAGVGITLTASDTLYFVEMGWTPGTMSQAEDRINRIGATSTSNIYYVVVDGTIDSMIAETLANKTENIRQLENSEYMVKPKLTQVISLADVTESDCEKYTFIDKVIAKRNLQIKLANNEYDGTADEVILSLLQKSCDANYIFSNIETKQAMILLGNSK